MTDQDVPESGMPIRRRPGRLPLMGALGRLFGLSALVGLGAGLGAVAFHAMLQLTATFVQRRLIGHVPPEVLGEPALVALTAVTYRPWLFLVVTPLGALVSSLIVQRWAPEAAGHGTDAAISAYHDRQGHIRPGVPPIKAVSAALTIGTGGSGGREGPIAQIGAGIGSALGRALKLPGEQRRVLMAAGMGAGVGAIFRAPLAGALFAGEILYSSAQIEHEVIVPAILSSIVAYSVFSMVFGWDSLFHVPRLAFQDPRELLLYTGLALLLAAAGIVFVRVFYGLEALFHRMPVPVWARPVVGGLLTGAVALWMPGASFTGYGEVQEALLGHSDARTLLLLALLRILTTSFSIGSGGSGGVFGPSMVIGGCLGGALGMVFHQSFPGLVPNPAAFAVVGMAGFFGGIAHAPVSTVIMASEMTGNYRLLVPALWVCAITFLLTQRHGLYRKQVLSWTHTPAHQTELMGALMNDHHVADAMMREVRVVDRLRTPVQLVPGLEAQPAVQVVVVDEQGRSIGLVESTRIRSAASDPVLASHPVRDLMHGPVHTIPTSAPLSEAVERLADDGIPFLVVVDPFSIELPVGVISRRELIAAYQAELLRRLELVHTGSVAASA